MRCQGGRSTFSPVRILIIHRLWGVLAALAIGTGSAFCEQVSFARDVMAPTVATFDRENRFPDTVHAAGRAAAMIDQDFPVDLPEQVLHLRATSNHDFPAAVVLRRCWVEIEVSALHVEHADLERQGVQNLSIESLELRLLLFRPPRPSPPPSIFAGPARLLARASFPARWPDGGQALSLPRPACPCPASPGPGVLPSIHLSLRLHISRPQPERGTLKAHRTRNESQRAFPLQSNRRPHR